MSPTSHHEPLLSVVCICYNQEAFIAQALEGFLAQGADFGIEIIVADDASTDRTAAIVASYAAAHPTIRPILRTINVGVQANLVDALEAARGRYVALCEGDDYWTDPGKLARQVETLEAHPEASLCFHPVSVEGVGLEDTTFPSPDERGDMTLERLLNENFIQTNSVVYRRLSSYADTPLDILPLDWFLHIRHAITGSIVMLPEVMAVYRRHPGGIWWESETTNPAFWARNGPAMARMCEAVLRLGGDGPGWEEAALNYSVLVASRLSVLRDTAGLLAETTQESPHWAARAIQGLDAGARRTRDDLATITAVAQERLADLHRLIADTDILREGLSSTHEVLAAREAQLAVAHERLTVKNDRILGQRRRIRRQEAEIRRLRSELETLHTRRLDPMARLRNRVGRAVSGGEQQSP